MSALERAISRPAPVRDFGARSPLHGLDRRSVGFFDVLAQSVSAVAPSAAATTVVLLVAGVSPQATVFAVLIAGVLSLLVARTVSQFARRLGAAGAVYTYTAHGLGTGGALAAGAAILVGYGAIVVFALLGGAYYTTILLGDLWPALHGTASLIAVLAVEALLLVLVLVRGIRLSARVALVVEAVSVALIVVLLVTLLVRMGPIDVTVLLPRDVSPAALAAGSVIALTAFVGFESAATLGVEARSPLRTVPKAIAWTVVLSVVLYLLAAVTQVAGFDAIGLDLAASASPINDLTRAYGVAGWGVLADAGIAASFLACAIGSTTALSRVLFTMSRDGVLPRRIGRTHPRWGTPVGALAVALPVVLVVPIGLLAAGMDVRAVMHLTISVGAAGYITAYVLVCIAAPAFLRRIGELTPGAAVVSWVSAIALAAALIAFFGVDAASGSAAVWVALALAALVAAGIRWWMRRGGARTGRVGSYDEPVAAQVLGGVAREVDPRNA
ncbi:APC family permease [Microbacterium sp. SORGH_AS_0888]|uniref:APC family permease n=1 Tax=Microbacterium sp. SORGH_AS_0888 TaxID=3041791 RepID=UPI00277D28C6|nr:APC family permease [Microbacterium sp. SORGH_AS_0888]MDQ1128847.1 amino acid transporter [Microbacterium sp. SORGH_AS_0888]